ncbi:MAG: hypothetical protein AcusKO_17750 [Acuticoccus sp.]
MLACTFLPAQATAQSDDAAATASLGVEARRQSLFVAMLNDPSNLDIAFEYAMLSAQVGDYEAAISTLERMLVYAPNLPRIQLELGVLYYRIGAIEEAKAYLEAARNAASVPPQVVERVDAFLAEADANSNRLTVSGSVYAGGRFQTNANASPEDDIVNINGVPIRLDPNARAQADFNVFALTDVHFAYDLQNQNDLIEANITVYNSLYADISRLNLQIIEAQLGPSFGFGRFGLDGARLGVYGIAGATLLGSSLYSTQYGVGGVLQTRLWQGALFDSRNEFRSLNYHDSNNYPTVRLQTGEEFSTVNTITASVHPQFLLQAQGYGRFVWARTDYNTYAELGGSARGTYFFYGPSKGILTDEAPWTVSLAAGGLFRDFDGPDPLIDPTQSEEDGAYWVEAGLSAPLEHDFSAFLTGQVRKQSSNYATRDYLNGVVTFGVSKRF